MARRPIRDQVKCAKPGCGKYAHYEYDSQRERVEAAKRRREHPYRCVRHSHEGEVLSPESTERTGVLIASKVYHRGEPISGLYWLAPGSTSGSGFTYGPGFRAFAEDFPEGTRLVITARVEPPTPTTPETP